MPKQDSRAGQLNAIIDPKLLFLAKLAARYKGDTLIQFIENALRKALTVEAMEQDEANAGHNAPFKQEASLWFESLWDEDEVTRLFMVAAADVNLLAPKQRELFHHVLTLLAKQGKKSTLTNFKKFFDASEKSE